MFVRSFQLAPRISRKFTGPLLSGLRFFHSKYNATLEEQTCKLSDGRDIGFAEYGVQDGVPAFFFHGAPGSRYDGIIYDEPARKLGVRIICPDRPGHGYSSPKPGRTLSSYVKDISDLAKTLAIKKYHVFGQSGGGPYVVSCAYASPQDELLNATVVAGMGPPAVLDRKTAGLYTVLALGYVSRFPKFSVKVSDWFYPKSFWESDEKIKKMLGQVLRFLSKEDRALMEKPEAMEQTIATLRAAYAQGAAGTLGDNLIYSGPWDFELKDIQRRVGLIFGDKDNRTPIAFGRHYKQNLPDAELIELDDASHFTIDRYAEPILARVIGKDSSRVNVRLTEEATKWSLL